MSERDDTDRDDTGDDDVAPGSLPPSEPQLTSRQHAELGDALAELGLLPPETPQEVARAEREIDEASVQLPIRLAHFEPRATAVPLRLLPSTTADNSTVTAHDEHHAARSSKRWRAGASGALGFVLGAAAVAVAWLSTPQPEPELPQLGSAGNELRERPEPEREVPLKLDLEAPCESCCAGNQCTTASTELSSCASGRNCIACGTADAKNAFRLRISAVGFGDTGRSWAARHGNPEQMQLCAHVQGRALGCRPATEQATDLVEWTSLPVATTSSQLVGGLELRLQQNENEVLASWSSAVTVSADTLCRGVAARLAAADGSVVGRVSAFFDDAYFVELGRAESVTDLLEAERRFQIEGAKGNGPRVYQTNDPKLGFTLVVGPTDRSRAEAIRWQLLDQGFDAPITFGADHRGAPRPR